MTKSVTSRSIPPARCSGQLDDLAVQAAEHLVHAAHGDIQVEGVKGQTPAGARTPATVKRERLPGRRHRRSPMPTSGGRGSPPAWPASGPLATESRLLK